MYIDDGFLIAKSASDLTQAAVTVRNDLTAAGFVINVEKTNWSPQQTVKWLGFELDSKNNTFIVPKDKLKRMKKAIEKNLYYVHSCSAREISRTVGQICSLFHALGHVVYLLT